MRCHVKGEIFTTEVVSLESEKDLLFEDFFKKEKFRYNSEFIGHSVANGSPPLRHYFERSCVARAL